MYMPKLYILNGDTGSCYSYVLQRVHNATAVI